MQLTMACRSSTKRAAGHFFKKQLSSSPTQQYTAAALWINNKQSAGYYIGIHHIQQREFAILIHILPEAGHGKGIAGNRLRQQCAVTCSQV